MDRLTACGCHEDYHDLGVHRPGYQSSPTPPTGTDDDLEVRGAA